MDRIARRGPVTRSPRARRREASDAVAGASMDKIPAHFRPRPKPPISIMPTQALRVMFDRFLPFSGAAPGSGRSLLELDGGAGFLELALGLGGILLGHLLEYSL